MASELFIPILLGTAREGRRSEKVARFVLAEATAVAQFATELIDVRDFVRSGQTAAAMSEEQSRAWSGTMRRADGLIIVAPEYNHGYPGELKLMLDELYEEYNRKPVGICGTGGRLGGARMVETLRIAVIELQMVPIRTAVYFTNIETLFDENGIIREPAAYRKRLAAFFHELVWYAGALKVAREPRYNPASSR